MGKMTEQKLKEKVEKYFSLTKEAFEKVKITDKDKKGAQDLLDLAQRYYDDAHFFKGQGDLVNAYGAVCYAHAFLDAGARLGLFDVGGDNRLFMVDPKK